MPIIIGARTAAAVGRLSPRWSSTCLQVKGKTEPERIYTILGRTGDALATAFTALEELNARCSRITTAANGRVLETILRCSEPGREAGLEEFYNATWRASARLLEPARARLERRLRRGAEIALKLYTQRDGSTERFCPTRRGTKSPKESY